MTVIPIGQEFAHYKYIKEYIKDSYAPRKDYVAQPYHALEGACVKTPMVLKTMSFEAITEGHIQEGDEPPQ